MLAKLVFAWGHEARVACDGPTALKFSAEFLPNLVLAHSGRAKIGWGKCLLAVPRRCCTLGVGSEMGPTRQRLISLHGIGFRHKSCEVVQRLENLSTLS